MGTGTLGVDNTFWDTFTIEVGKQIDVVKIYRGSLYTRWR
jgi:hypothetical protein